jgi:hypothetical protein
VGLTLTTKRAHLRGSLCSSGDVLTGQIHYTHINNLCTTLIIAGAYYKFAKANTHLFLRSIFLFLFLDAYYILFHTTSLFYVHSVFCRLPHKFCRTRRPPSLPSGEIGCGYRPVTTNLNIIIIIIILSGS